MRPDEQNREHRRLKEVTHQNLLRLIDSEMKVAVTLSRLAQTRAQFGDGPHARALLEKVELAMSCVRHYMANREVSDDERRATEDRMREVTKIVDDARQCVSEASRA